jgi:hypothetical protein
MYRKIILSIFVVVFFTSNVCAENWFDSFGDMQFSNPAHLETQKRGYFSMGGVSYKTHLSKQSFVGVTMPRMQVGCGGIEMFWGGLNYMQPEYLVQAFQNIMSAAPAFAFDIALKVLCEQCYEIKSTLESIANLVNQMAMDECGAARALANAAGNYVTNKLQEMGYDGGSSGTWHSDMLEAIQGNLTSAKEELDNFYGTEFCGWTKDEHSVFGPCKQFANLCNGPKSFWTDVARLESAQATEPDNPFFGCDCSDSGCNNCYFLYLVSGLFGDLFVSGWQQKEGGILGEVAMEYKQPKVNYKDKKVLIDLLQHLLSQDGKMQIIGMQFVKNGDSYEFKDVILDDDKLKAIQFGKKANDAIEEIIEAFKDGTGTLSTSTIEFINEQELPLWKIINMLLKLVSQPEQATAHLLDE